MTTFGIIYPPTVLLYNYKYKQRTTKKDKSVYYFYWNLFLSTFSIWGALNSLPFIINSIYTEGVTSTIINNNLWDKMLIPAMLFAPSKIVELGDTYFIAIRGRKIRFIHYFHHWITMLYCWHAHYYIGNGINAIAICCSMNYTVHSFMYTWYSISALGIRTPVWIKHSITIMQIVQMFIGLYIVLIANIYGKWYLNDFYGSLFATLMYSYYCYLFSNFFVKITRRRLKCETD